MDEDQDGLDSNSTPDGVAPPSPVPAGPSVSAAPAAADSPSPAAAVPAAAPEDEDASEGSAPPSADATAAAAQPNAGGRQNPFAKSYFSALRALGGADTAQVVRDPQTGQVTGVHVINAAPGDQFKRILAAFAAGVAATPGPGPGGATRALAAGTGAGIKVAQQRQADVQTNVDQANDFQDRQQKKMMQQAQSHLLDIQMADAAFRGIRAKTDAAWLDADRMAKTSKDLADSGAVKIGTVADMDDVRDLKAERPDLYKLSAGAMIQPVPITGKDGKLKAVDVYAVPPNWRDQRTTEDGDLPFQQPDGSVKYKTIPAGSMSNGEFWDAHSAQTGSILKNQQTKDAQAEETKRAGMREAGEDRRQAAVLAAKTTPGADDPRIATLGEAIAKGSLTEDQIPGFSKDRPAIEAYLAQHHPNLDQKSVLLDAGMRKQVNLANNALHNLNDIDTRLQKRPELIGVIDGRVSQGKTLAGTNDPDLGAINIALGNYALASTGAHGVKAKEARSDARADLLNHFKNGPQAVAAAIQEARASLNNLASAGKPKGIDGSPYVYDKGPAANAPAAIPPRPAGVPAGSIYIQDSGTDPNKPHFHWVPDVDAARKIDPNLKVIGQ